MAEIGEAADLIVIRDGQEQTLTVTIGQQDQVQTAELTEETEKASGRMLGVTVAPLTQTARSDIGVSEDISGVVVTSLAPSGPAAQAGLQVGDVIVRFGNEDITTPDMLKDALQAEEADPALVLINRGGRQIFVAVELA